ncbi:UvrD-helicase domain-containing protein [Sphingomonas sp. KRR8]|uniref:ATP-dependent helicase n=1 Tax=Sphingomonas sp. KRR8 TaxID=2942996 RepID=UPI00201FC251|nr:UvrD-helicase domain-containing protein [Sphingomonas sp. KRR8]URD62263.1 UvrD-helicase domain-containing protein [Sphingomonas sp. KRR8]
MSEPVLAPAAQPEPGYLQGLNAPQREAVLTTDGPVLVLAGAGTGKTAALTARLAHLIATRRAWPSQILAVTFTNKAAREMKERVSRISGGAIEGMPWLGTFHSIGAKMLRIHAELAGLQSNFTILDTDDQLRLLKQLITAANLDEKRWPARQLASCIDRWKNKGLVPADVDAGESEAFANGRGGELYAQYQERLKTLNACDFGDLLLHMLTVFRTHADVLEQYRERFRYILVDEYQDTNAVQYEWLKMLAEPRRNLCCVGDDDQSIYSWRGAEVANILRFEQDFPGAAVIRLEQNYRSTPHILGAASGLIAHNSGRLGKTLWTEVDAGDKVKVVGVWDGPEEARRVGEDVEAHQRSGGSPDDVAILVRASFQTREFEERFIAIGLPYQIVGGFRFYERAEIRDALAYLRLIQSPADDLAFERIVNTPKRGLGDKAVAAIHRHARGAGLPLLLAAAQMLDSDEMTPQARRSLGRFVGDFARWRQMHLSTATDGANVPAEPHANRSAPHAELARLMLEESGYTAMLQAERSAEAAGRLENLAELARAMEEYENLSAFLEHVSLVMDNDSNRGGEKVTVMTIHAAKGLEFPIVYLAGWEEGVFPSQRAVDEGGLASLEEERRLAYVAITRARRQATIFHAANRRIYGQWTSSIPSRFISELPADHVEQETTMTGGESLWRAQWSEYGDPFAHVARASSRGPGFQRAASDFRAQLDDRTGRPAHRAGVVRPPVEVRASAVSLGNKGRDDLSLGQRVFHGKFGYGTIALIEGNKLEIDFEHAGRKRVLDSFVSVG